MPIIILWILVVGLCLETCAKLACLFCEQVLRRDLQLSSKIGNWPVWPALMFWLVKCYFASPFSFSICCSTGWSAEQHIGIRLSGLFYFLCTCVSIYWKHYLSLLWLKIFYICFVLLSKNRSCSVSNNHAELCAGRVRHRRGWNYTFTRVVGYVSNHCQR